MVVVQRLRRRRRLPGWIEVLVLCGMTVGRRCGIRGAPADFMSCRRSPLVVVLLSTVASTLSVCFSKATSMAIVHCRWYALGVVVAWLTIRRRTARAPVVVGPRIAPPIAIASTAISTIVSVA